MRVALVNDLAMSNVFLRRIIEDIGDCEIAWEAGNGAEAVEMCRRDRPDLILMDLVMPVMNGADATRIIMKQNPCAILLVTAGVAKNASLVFEALGAGALDAVDMPAQNEPASIDALIRKIRTVRKLIVSERRTPSPVHRRAKDAGGDGMLVAMGASTGGPAVLKTILNRLPGDLPAAVVIVQHVDQQFAAGMASWLDQDCAMPVRVVEEGEPPLPGTVWLACTNDHLVIDREQRLRYTEHPQDVVYRPSIDVFFASAALHWRGDIIGVLLTGMGRDGARGLLELNRLGHYTMIQDQASSAVYSMPRAAMELGAARKQLTPEEIGGMISTLVQGVDQPSAWRKR